MTWWASFRREHLNLPNGLSLLRAVLGLLIPFLLFFRIPAIHFLAGALFTFAAITDYLDGSLARKYNLVSNFGKILDPTSDKLLILTPLAVFSYLGYFSPWWLVPIFLREGIVTFCRIGWYCEGKAAGAEKLGKIKLVIQMVLVANVFLQLILEDYNAPALFQQIIDGLTVFWLVVTNLLTFISGISFLKSNQTLFKSSYFLKFVSACGVGLLPGPAGTWGSLFAAVMIPLLAWNWILYWVFFIFLFWTGYTAMSSMDFSLEKDPQYIVMDEVLGMFVVFAFVPVTWVSLILGFILFRLLDIIKPFPCRYLERFKGFWGITLDDLGAGIYSGLILRFFFHI